MPDQMTIQAPPAKMTTGDLLAALRAHYVPPVDISQRRQGEAGEPDLLVEEVCAPRSNRRCDLLRIGMWQSRGHRIIVHELKVSRADWLRELADPAKAEAWWPYCHEFWIVAPDGVVDPDELPDGWGLMVPPASQRYRKFRVKKKATSKAPELTAGLMVEIARRVDNYRLGQIARLNSEREEMIYKALQEQRQSSANRALNPDLQRRLELLERLENAIGARLDSFGWEGNDLRPATVSPDELSAALREYTVDHVALQRRSNDLRRATEDLERGARFALKAIGESTEVAP
jgi:hypothetical protein